MIILTVHRRYHELLKTLSLIEGRAAEFALPPKIIVVWACPEVGRLWLFQELIAAGRISLLTRPELPGEGAGRPTSYPESHNLRSGLEEGKFLVEGPCYFIGQTADVLPREGIYGMLDGKMQGGETGVLFHWENQSVRENVWHTNFFAVGEDEAYWPPVAEPGSSDVLERQWGAKLCSLQKNDFFVSSNYNAKRFEHVHASEDLPPFPEKPQAHGDGLAVFIQGPRTWWGGLIRRLGKLFRG